MHIALALKFRSLARFESIFVYGVRQRFNFVVLNVVIHLFQHHLLKTILFSLNGFGTLVKNQFAIDVWVYFVFSTLLHLFIYLLLMPVLDSFDCCSLAVSFEVRKFESYLPPFSMSFGLSEVLRGSILVFPFFAKKAFRILMKAVLNL